MKWNIVISISPRDTYIMLQVVIVDDGTIQCPSSSKVGDVGDFNDLPVTIELGGTL